MLHRQHSLGAWPWGCWHLTVTKSTTQGFSKGWGRPYQCVPVPWGWVALPPACWVPACLCSLTPALSFLTCFVSDSEPFLHCSLWLPGA